MTMAEKNLQARKIAVHQYNARVLYDMDDEQVFYKVETFGIYCFTSLRYTWKELADAVRYCDEQIKAGVQARVTKNQFSKQNNTLSTEVVYTR